MNDNVFLFALRYEKEAYGHCDYYANRMRTVSGVDWTGPFFWEFKFRRSLNEPCLHDTVTATEPGREQSITIEEVSEESNEDRDEIMEDTELSECDDNGSEDMDSDDLSEEWHTAEDDSITDDWNAMY